MLSSSDDPGAAASLPRFRLWHLFALTAWVGVGTALSMYLDTPVAVALLAFGTLLLAAVVCRSWYTAVAAFGLALLMVFFPTPRGGSRPAGLRAQCRNSLRNVVLALQNYEGKYGTFPPAVVTDKHGKPMHSWRVLILPFLDRNDLYKRYRFNEPWNGPNNSQLLNEDVGIFYCPSDVRGTNDFHTSYVAVVGDRTVWPGTTSGSTKAVSQADGTSRTLILVETHNSGIHWMEPRDISFDNCLIGIDGPRARSLPRGECNHPGGSVVSFVDGHVEFLEDSVSATKMRELLTIDDGAPAETNVDWAK